MNITLGDAISGVTVYVWRYAHTNAWGAIVDVPGLRVLSDPAWGQSNFQSFC